MIPTKNPQEEDLNELSIFDDPYAAAINPETRPVLQCIDCGQNGAVPVPRYGDGEFCNVDCRDSHHLKNYNQIFHGDIPTVNIKDIKKASGSVPLQQLIVRQDSPLQHQLLIRTSQRQLCPRMSSPLKGHHTGFRLAPMRLILSRKQSQLAQLPLMLAQTSHK